MAKGKKVKTETNQTIDPYTRGLISEGRGNIRQIQNDNPFQSYEGQRVAGLNETQTGARDSFTANQGAGTGLISEAAGAARAAGGYAPERITAQSFGDADMSQYNNPFTEGVIDANRRSIQSSRDQTLAGQRDDMVASGAFGGSRSGIAQAETTKNYAQQEAEMDARLRSEQFNTAAGLFQNDANRDMAAQTTNANLGMQGQALNLQGAGLMGQLGNQMDASNRANAGMMNAFGSQEQGLEQAGLDAQYQDFMRQDQDTQRRIAQELSMMGMVPTLVDGTTTQTQTPGLMDWMQFGMNAGSTALAMSDRRVKKAITPDGKIGKHDAYTFRYIWDSDDAPLRRGVMAQDLLKTLPEAVIQTVSGYMAVDYSKLEAA